jgi:hypothetical protein
MKYWQKFTSYKQRGEWVELKFMAEAGLLGQHRCVGIYRRTP